MRQQSHKLETFTIDKFRKRQPAFNPIYFAVCTKLVPCRTENTIEILTNVIKRLKEGDERELEQAQEQEELELEQGQEGDKGNGDEQEDDEQESDELEGDEQEDTEQDQEGDEGDGDEWESDEDENNEQESTKQEDDEQQGGEQGAAEQETTKQESIKQEGNRKPILIFAFDEAHVLTKKKFGCMKSLTMFDELRRALRSIRDLDIFSLFLSTTTIGNISQFGGDTVNDPSSRIQKRKIPLFPPFTDMGFDQFARDTLSKYKPLTLGCVSSIDTIISFGRPL